MPNRARLLPFTAPLFVAVACSGPAPTERTQAHASSAETAVMPATCDPAPWVGNAYACGAPTFEHGHVTCADLDLAAGGTDATLTGPASVALDDGYVMTLYLNNPPPNPPLPASWAITTTVKADGTTRTVDAIIIDGAPNGDSLVFRFDPPEWYVRNMQIDFAATQIQLCGIRPGHSASLPPPPPDQTFSLACTSSTGAAAPPGPTLPDATSIDYDVTVSPTPPDGSLVRVEGILDGGSSNRGNAYYETTNGRISGSDYAQYLAGAKGALELRFMYGSGTCSLYWTLGESSTGGGGGRAW